MGGAAGDAGVRQVGRAGRGTRCWSRSSPSPSAAICASAVQAPWPMSCAPISITPEPSRPQHGAGAWPGTSGPGRWRCPCPSRPASPSSSRICRGASGRPAQPNRAAPCVVALAQRLGGERLAGHRLDLGVVLAGGTPAGPCRRPAAISSMALSSATLPVASPGARMNSGVPVSSRTASCEVRDRRAGVERVRGVGGGLEEVVERARRGLGVVVDRGQRAVGVGADAQRLPGRRAVADGAVHLLAPQHQLDRAGRPAGRP